MPRSQNAIFRGTAEHDIQFEHLAGISITGLLAAKLPEHDWAVTDIENWRDCGWLLPCSRGNQSLDLVVVPCDEADLWMLQISASRFPFFILRWLGAAPSADPDAIFQLSVDTHSVLRSSGYSEFLWMWDGPPDVSDAISEPQPAA